MLWYCSGLFVGACNAVGSGGIDAHIGGTEVMLEVIGGADTGVAGRVGARIDGAEVAID